VEVVASLSQVRTAAAQCGLFTHKSVPVIFEPPCIRDGNTKDSEPNGSKRPPNLINSLNRGILGGGH